MATTRVLFVCLGNICRSPLAEGIFLHMVRERGLTGTITADSAGTGHWHIGKPADKRSIEVGRKHGVDVPSKARQVDPRTDFVTPDGTQGFDYIIAMDLDNKKNLANLGCPQDRLSLMLSLDASNASKPETSLEVPDPYYGEDDGFERVYQMLHGACAGLLDEITKG